MLNNVIKIFVFSSVFIFLTLVSVLAADVPFVKPYTPTIDRLGVGTGSNYDGFDFQPIDAGDLGSATLPYFKTMKLVGDRYKHSLISQQMII